MNAPSINAVSEFLYYEAHLLDTWQLREWADLFADDGVYLVPPPSEPEGDPSHTLFLIYDDRDRIRERAIRLMKNTAHAEFPKSVTTHLISNIAITAVDAERLSVRSTFVVYRARGAKFDVFPGHSRYEMSTNVQGGIKIHSKRAMLGIEALRPQDKLTIIL
ncbi:benzoate 1,2-dioxygenase subunit beta [Caballeronia udeis]|uniref:Benzoate 1,2-dioxygenase subunit beta n=1 Tax=Caballeronia udeis TaxID=1232866 RepID=A0A158JJZ4_9BURK|nr:aromatic-ring-hydroxylating dioxygenase subunit beta [Caballeronia udeis]SAL68670.1 benzoate 1,2-dioxygenase subunit beta [Caballeronia udeis]